MMTQSKIWNVTSLFSGCGGLDLGFIGGFKSLTINYQALPFNIVMAYDNDPKCVKTYMENIGSHIEMKDLSDFDPNELPSSDVLIGLSYLGRLMLLCSRSEKEAVGLKSKQPPDI